MRFACLFLAWTGLFAQTPVDGSWEGSLQSPAGKLRLRLHVTSGPGGLAAKLDSVDQGAFGLPVDTVTFAGGLFRWEMKALNASFEGKLQEGGKSLAGTFRQGMELPLSFAKLDKVPEPPRRPQEPKPPFPYEVTEVSFPNKQAGITLAGTLTAPKGKGPFPAVALISGSGPQDRNEEVAGHKIFLVLADHLTRAGIAVLRYDDRGFGKSTGNFGLGTTADFATDAAAAVDYLKGRTEVDAKRIGLIGHSEGGIIAPLVANGRSDVAFVVLMAPTAVTGSEVIIGQTKAIGRAMHAPEEALKSREQAQRKSHAVMREEKDPAAIAQRLRDLGSSEAEIRAMSSPWFRHFVVYDPAPELAKLKPPVLVINGELDLQVLPDQNLPVVESMLKKAGNANFRILRMPGLNHLFQTAKTGAPTEYATIEETMAPAALQAISSWIRGQAR